MDQNKPHTGAMNLDEMERQLPAASGAPIPVSDPLSELARLVAEDSTNLSTSADASIDDLFEDFLRGSAPLSVIQPPRAAAESPLETPVGDVRAEAAAVSGTPVDVQVQAPSIAYDAMLAEFEATLRDAKVDTAPQNEYRPVDAPAAPSTIPGSVLAGTIAAGAGALAAGAAIAKGGSKIAEARPRPQRRGLMLAGGVLGVAAIGVVALFAFSSNRSSSSAGRTVPTIAAAPGVVKERPANPGGAEQPNLDKEVLQARQPTRLPERVTPTEEQPLDLTASQRQTASASGVRQIPGVSVVAPVTTTPPSAQSAAQPVPRPVASVPITIVGEPTPQPVQAPAPAAVATPSPIPTLSVPTLPPVSAPPAAPPVAAITPSAPQRAAPAQPPSATTATAEPRRVRAVPIRAEDGGAPSRAQAQPRVVTAPGVRPAPEPDPDNAPLNLSPQRTAAVARPQPTRPAAASPGGFSVQLAAEGSEEQARSKFNQLRSRHAGVLSGASPSIQSAEVNGRAVYRVRVNSATREEAVSLCERLKASGGSCFVARN